MRLGTRLNENLECYYCGVVYTTLKTIRLQLQHQIIFV